jgi:hypothetical protein
MMEIRAIIHRLLFMRLSEALGGFFLLPFASNRASGAKTVLQKRSIALVEKTDSASKRNRRYSQCQNGAADPPNAGKSTRQRGIQIPKSNGLGRCHE